MMPRQAPRVLLIILSATIIWSVFLLLQRPILRGRGETTLDWGNVVGFPLLIVGMVMVSRYLMRRNNPSSRTANPGPGEAIATGTIWGIVKAFQEHYTFGALSLAPIISGAVVCMGVLLGNWLIARLSRER
jgi:uncharacterized BrkB/YihY/UPF0761 family membrane protein